MWSCTVWKVFVLNCQPWHSVALLRQIFSFREIEKRRCTKNPRVQLVFLQKTEPERAQERHRYHQPAVSVNVESFYRPNGRIFTQTKFLFLLRIQKRKHNRVKTWTRHVDLFQKDFIFVPINESWVRLFTDTSFLCCSNKCFPRRRVSLPKYWIYSILNPHCRGKEPIFIYVSSLNPKLFFLFKKEH